MVSDLSLDAVPKRSVNIVSRSIAGECLLVPVTKRTADTSHLFTLGGVSAFIWERIDGGSSLRAILDQVIADYHVDPAEAEADLIAFIGQLRDLGAVELP